MMRLSAIQEADHPELAEAVAKVKAGRGGRYIQPYKLLLHSPDIALAWLEQLSAVRWKTLLDGQVREIAILRVATLKGCHYAVREHTMTYGPKEGLTKDQIAALADWRGSALFSESQRAALAYIDAMTNDVNVPDAVQDGLQRHFSERQIIELTVLVATYIMHAHVFQALQIEQRVAAENR